jgi:hypothetical protein
MKSPQSSDNWAAGATLEKTGTVIEQSLPAE